MRKKEVDALHPRAAVIGSLDEERKALDAGRRCQPNSNERATEQLYNAVKTGDLLAAKAALEAGANVNLKATLSQTPLHMAAAAGNIDLAKLLIERGANVNAMNAANKTPLDTAVNFGRSDIVHLLQSAAMQPAHAVRITKGRKDNGPPRVGS